MKPRKAMISLSLLLMLSSMLLIVLFFQDDLIKLYSRLIIHRQQYTGHTFKLQQKMQDNKAHFCHSLPIDNRSTVMVEFIEEDTDKQDNPRYAVICRRIDLFLRSPTTHSNINLIREYINFSELTRFKTAFSSLDTMYQTQPTLLWLDKHTTELSLNGDWRGIILSESNLYIGGKGKIYGSIITGGNLQVDNGIQLVYNRAAVNRVVSQFRQWQLGEKSWNDFSP